MDSCIITLDVDWAPDFVIDFVANLLIEQQVKATWFITHASPAIDRLRLTPELFELGIHPNFLANSTHGETPVEILRHCVELVPEALSMRTHGLVQSTALLALVMTNTPIVTDVSLFLSRGKNLHPYEYYWHGRRLLRIPYFWEDDFEMERPSANWLLAPLLDNEAGLKIFDFHPIHIYLNSANMEAYNALKMRVPYLSQALADQVEPYIQSGDGTQTMFSQIVTYLSQQSSSYRISDIASGIGNGWL